MSGSTERRAAAAVRLVLSGVNLVSTPRVFEIVRDDGEAAGVCGEVESFTTSACHCVLSARCECCLGHCPWSGRGGPWSERGEEGLGVVKRDVSFPPRVISRGSGDTGTDRREEKAELRWYDASGFVGGDGVVGWDGDGGVTRAVTSLCWKGNLWAGGREVRGV